MVRSETRAYGLCRTGPTGYDTRGVRYRTDDPARGRMAVLWCGPVWSPEIGANGQGWMFWFSRKRLSGSHWRFKATNR